eukprot:723991-Amphidinium_carterae.1
MEAHPEEIPKVNRNNYPPSLQNTPFRPDKETVGNARTTGQPDNELPLAAPPGQADNQNKQQPLVIQGNC